MRGNEHNTHCQTNAHALIDPVTISSVSFLICFENIFNNNNNKNNNNNNSNNNNINRNSNNNNNNNNNSRAY